MKPQPPATKVKSQNHLSSFNLQFIINAGSEVVEDHHLAVWSQTILLFNSDTYQCLDRCAASDTTHARLAKALGLDSWWGYKVIIDSGKRCNGDQSFLNEFNMAVASVSYTHPGLKPFDGSGFENWLYRLERLLERNAVLEMLSVDPPDVLADSRPSEVSCELSVSTTEDKTEEIIEFPCLKVASATFQVEDVFHQYVQPKLNKVLSPFCIELTGILQAFVQATGYYPRGIKDMLSRLNLKHKGRLHSGIVPLADLKFPQLLKVTPGMFVPLPFKTGHFTLENPASCTWQTNGRPAYPLYALLQAEIKFWERRSYRNGGNC
uniref:Exonuclease domain-containing protein n=1 Tax=Timema tahoe TaxID=61484 RepID=A0A7R9IL05_9NEOP|nr:unnamed protein product [Timema tahoe]